MEPAPFSSGKVRKDQDFLAGTAAFSAFALAVASFLQSARNFLRAAPCSFFASASAEHSLPIAVLATVFAAFGASVLAAAGASVFAAGALAAGAAAFGASVLAAGAGVC